MQYPAKGVGSSAVKCLGFHSQERLKTVFQMHSFVEDPPEMEAF